MASSRIFITNLPPKISDDEFKKHFSRTSPITDAKLILNRRIGYVGYKTPDDAANAVKYFNRSFIRMSKIRVDIARPISDTSLPLSRKAQREQLWERQRSARHTAQNKIEPVPLNPGIKRKRSDADNSDPKLKEFLQLMQPASKAKIWNTQEDAEVEPPTKIQAIELPETESDGEYGTVPTQAMRKCTALMPLPPDISPTTANPVAGDILTTELISMNVTDDEWLRNRKSRLLDLMQPEDLVSTESLVTANAINIPMATISTQCNQHSEKTIDLPTEDAVVAESQKNQSDNIIDSIKATGRLFVRNLPYNASEDELRRHFSSCGLVEELHLPVDAAGTSKGFALVRYADSNAATEAFHNLDGEAFQGRLLHILPGSAKRENKLDEVTISKLPLKKQKQIKRKAEASSNTFNWNSLYMDQDAVNSIIANRLGVSKSEMLDPTSTDSGWKQAIAETSVIQETKMYFLKNGVDLESFKKCERGDTVILVKNLSHGMTLEGVRNMFEEFGQVLQVLMPPAGTIAIVEFAQPAHAKAAFRSLAYRRVKDSVLFLEKAPRDLFTSVSRNARMSRLHDVRTSKAPEQKLSVSDLLERESAADVADTSTLFVRNLNFTTTSDRLTEIFKPLSGFMSARVNTRTDSKKPGQVLSMGFGFLEFRTKAQAQAALTAMDGYNLDGHKLVIKASHKGLDAAEERRRQDKAKKEAGKRTKIIIKNLPFEATKKDVRSLFGAYGQLRSVRVPKRFDSSARGFAFADFITAREAENALEALKDTHLLGRRLVLEFATGDVIDAEEEIEKMQKKVRSQLNKVALQNLTGRGRKKFDVEGNDREEE